MSKTELQEHRLKILAKGLRGTLGWGECIFEENITLSNPHVDSVLRERMPLSHIGSLDGLVSLIRTLPVNESTRYLLLLLELSRTIPNPNLVVKTPAKESQSSA